jgi:DNA-binding PadR family transcriptional regulator
MMILRSLLREPMHGYALVQHIKQRSNELLQVEEGSLYPALQRMLREGLLKAEWEISASNRRVRTYRDHAGGEKAPGARDVQLRENVRGNHARAFPVRVLGEHHAVAKAVHRPEEDLQRSLR